MNAWTRRCPDRCCTANSMKASTSEFNNVLWHASMLKPVEGRCCMDGGSWPACPSCVTAVPRASRFFSHESTSLRLDCLQSSHTAVRLYRAWGASDSLSATLSSKGSHRLERVVSRGRSQEAQSSCAMIIQFQFFERHIGIHSARIQFGASTRMHCEGTVANDQETRHRYQDRQTQEQQVHAKAINLCK
ncbi:hypothetical protein BC629DRAFT_1175714 [Irpex lacteus]|nr:hypothetical protein BC629DRAFT_1175714 [Irpex lacteus]